MAQVIFKTQMDQVKIVMPHGTNLLAAARAAGIDIDAPCAGNGTCGKCKVQMQDALVLACQTVITTDIEVGMLTAQSDEVAIVCCGYGVASGGTQPGGVEKIDLEADYGLAIDIGTTTLVVSLLQMESGREIAAAAALNPQCGYAGDVLSRIRFAATVDGLQTMQAVLLVELNRLIAELLEETGLVSQRIATVVISGNTCMLHLVVGMDPTGLGKYPYKALFCGDVTMAAVDIGLNLPVGMVYFPPIISAYIGADITAGIIASGLHQLPGTTLFVDVGTNGEMVLAQAGKLWTASTAAGPAFEGMNISCGMRAAAGAVEKYKLLDGEVQLKTVKDAPAKGICGSGLLDIVSELARCGVIQSTGKLADSADWPAGLATATMNGKEVVSLADGVHLSQRDIRQVQLAKGAVRAGVEALLAEQALTADQVDRVFVAGSFGYHLNEDSLIQIGMLPPDFAGKIEYLGNTALRGSQRLVAEHSLKTAIVDMAKTAQVLELSAVQGFDRLFVRCMNF